ncbi:cation diffusion facilitator family transporter [bacterium]|nr:cation diffusion facilitator family transporter [bacterium]
MKTTFKKKQTVGQKLKTLFWRDPEGLAMMISLCGGIVIVAVKVTAYVMSHSLALMADMTESLVHNLAVLFAAYCLWYSKHPADERHLYGHGKMQFFSAGLEGALICGAGILIWVESLRNWYSGYELQDVSMGVALAVFAMVFNGALGGYIVWLGKQKKSIILQANGKHVLSDSITTFSALLGMLGANVFDWLLLDLLVALGGALYIFFEGLKLIRESFAGLMDEADEEVDLIVRDVLEKECEEHDCAWHALRHRSEGNRHWLEVHLVFAKDASLQRAHDLATHLENVLRAHFDEPITITTHLEPEKQ